jgi:transcriptional regulator with XRE-family HTH domain
MSSLSYAQKGPYGWTRALTQEELSGKVGITVAALSHIARNNAEPRPTTRRKIAQALGVDPADLVE